MSIQQQVENFLLEDKLLFGEDFHLSEKENIPKTNLNMKEEEEVEGKNVD